MAVLTLRIGAVTELIELISHAKKAYLNFFLYQENFEMFISQLVILKWTSLATVSC